MLEVVEDVDIDFVKGAFLLQELAEAVVQVILFREFEDGLLGDFAEPNHGFPYKLGLPVAGTHQPGGYAAGEQGGRRLVHIEGDVVVLLQQGGRAVCGARAFGNGLYGRGLVFSPGHEHNSLGGEHGADTHGDGLVRSGHDVQVEVGGLALAGVIGQAHGAGARLFVGTGFVETDLSFLTDADDQQVQVTGNAVKLGAVFREFLRRNGAVRDVDVFLQDVHLVQQGFVETVVTALGTACRGRIILVDGDNLHILERNLALFKATGKLVIQGFGGRAGGQAQTEQAVLVGVDGIYDVVGNSKRGRVGIRIDIGPDFLIRVENSRRQVLVDEPAFIR